MVYVKVHACVCDSTGQTHVWVSVERVQAQLEETDIRGSEAYDSALSK